MSDNLHTHRLVSLTLVKHHADASASTLLGLHERFRDLYRERQVLDVQCELDQSDEEQSFVDASGSLSGRTMSIMISQFFLLRACMIRFLYR